MTDYRSFLATEHSQNWFKSAFAYKTAREGIVDFVENEIIKFHRDVLDSVLLMNSLPAGSTCNSCTTQNVLPCPTKGICRTDGRCLIFHTCCTKNICDRIAREIISAHNFHQPSWKNTDASKWCSTPWEVAKCFCPPDGYTSKPSAKDTDFNGLVSVMLNCKCFKTVLGTTAEETLKKVRKITIWMKTLFRTKNN